MNLFQLKTSRNVNDKNALTALFLEEDVFVEVRHQLLKAMSKHDVSVTSHTRTHPHTHLEDSINELARRATGCQAPSSQCPLLQLQLMSRSAVT